MNLQLFEFDALEKELEELPPLHRVAFAASICERLLPSYNAFCRIENFGDPSVPRKALDEVWQILQGKPVDAEKIRQLQQDLVRDDIAPHSDDFADSYDAESQEALAAIHYALKTCLDPTPRQIINVARCVSDTIYFFIPFIDASFYVIRDKDGKEKFMEALSHHPFAVREMAKQYEDLQRLKEVKTLDQDFLEWLRTSFDNGGKSTVDLS